MTVVLVGCGKAKLPRLAPARDLYTGGLFRQARAYAEKHADAWLILSAKHGVIHPDDVIAPYDVSMNDLTAAERAAWGEKVRRVLHELGAWDKTLVLLAGEKYEGAVKGAPRVLRPLEGLEMGYRRRWFKLNT